MALPNYVKFQRGSLAEYNALNRKDDNTLYFIYDANDQSKGSLYLGDRLISANIGGSGVSSLAELSDVIVANSNTGDFLVKNSEGKWAAVDVNTIASMIVEAGGLTASIDIDSNEFEFNSVNGQLELKDYNSAVTGMVPVKGDSGITWTNLPVDTSVRVGNLETSVTNINNKLTGLTSTVAEAIASAISNANHLSYQVINDLSQATATNVVYLYNNGANNTNNLYDEYMLVNNQLEKIGNFSADLSQYVTQNDFSIVTTQIRNLENSLDNYVTKTEFNAVVGDLTQLNAYSSATSINIADSLSDIYERLIWQNIGE